MNVILINIFLLSIFLPKIFNEFDNDFEIEYPKTSKVNFLWSYQTHAQAVFQGVNDIDLSSNGSYFVVGTEYSYVYLFNKSIDTPLWSYQETFVDNYVRSVSISANGEYIAVGYKSGSVYAFHKSSGVPLWQYITNDIVTSVEISSDGRYIIAGSRDNKVYLFNTTDIVKPLL